MPPVIYNPSKKYANVCMGGTFDTIHDGHKKLLERSLNVCSQSLTIGVTDESMIQKKILWELIKPTDERILNLKDYLSTKVCDMLANGQIDREIQLNIVPISDPFGPAIMDSSLEAIVVSDETIPGGQKINQIRSEKGMNQLDIISINLVEETGKESTIEEDKVSSSSIRIRKLGTLLKEPGPVDPKVLSGEEAYYIGLTGGIASGKSAIMAALAELGAGVIDCDKMAHKTYNQPGSLVHQKLLDVFGQDIVDPGSDNINRRILGSKVFGHPDLKAKLESIVWPATKELIDEEAQRLKRQEKKRVIVMEAALLVEAKWHEKEKINQVWMSIIPPEEAIRRVMNRDNLSEEDAKKRVASQMSNKERVAHAHVVFSTLWDREFTRSQVVKAWNMLNRRFLK